MKDYSITKEFFGGIIHDKKRSLNMKLDIFMMDFIELLENRYDKKAFMEKYDVEIKSLEIFDLFREMLDLGLYNRNYDFKSYANEDNVLSAPFRIFYDISYGCNLHCLHCFTDSGKKGDEELSLEEKRAFVDQCVELGVGRISIAGGEPFFCEDLFPFLDYCMEKKLGVSITTNGTLLSKKNVERLNKYSIKTLTVSMDGAVKESCEAVRGKGTYKEIIEGLSNVCNYYKGAYSVKTTIMKNNLAEIEELIKIAIKYRCSSIKFNCVREDGRAEKNSNDIILSAEEYVNTIKLIENIKEKYKKEIRIKAPLNPFCNEQYTYINELGFGCFAGKESICVDPTGNVRPCSHFPDSFICGNVKKETLTEIWRNSDVLNAFRKFSGNKECKECGFYDKCRGGCRYRAYLSGDINGKDTYCYKYYS